MCFPVGCAGTVSGLKPTPQGHHCFHSKKMPTDRFMNQQPLPKSFPFSPLTSIYTQHKSRSAQPTIFYQGIWNRVYPMILCRHIPPSHHSQTWLMGKLTGPPPCIFGSKNSILCPVDSQEKATRWRPPCGRLVPWAVNWSSTSRA